MRPNEVAVVLLAAIILLLVIYYFVTAKGERKRISLVNSEGSKISVDVEIANNTATRTKGLMGRASLGENEGMLFVFDRPGLYSFWMLNTAIPLDGIYFDENGTVVDVIGMAPCGLNVTKCRTYTPKASARYVLEVNQGFSERNKIAVGKSRLETKNL